MVGRHPEPAATSSEPHPPGCSPPASRSSTPQPYERVMPEGDAFAGCGDRPALAAIRAHLSRGGVLSEAAAVRLLSAARGLTGAERNVVGVAGDVCPTTVIGDVHGQFADLLRIMDAEGLPCEQKTVVFLGDYVDRGECGTEILLYVCACKVLFPGSVVVLRGNHESKSMCDRDGYSRECCAKYSRAVLDESFALFRSLPLACVVRGAPGGDCLCCHGGISPKITSLSQLEELDRFVEVEANPVLIDLLWSDPLPESAMFKLKGLSPEQAMEEWKKVTFAPNSDRSISWFYGFSAVDDFLKRNALVCIIRGHQTVDQGYRWHFVQGADVPRVVTLFSAPNYCKRYRNLGGYMRIDPKVGFQMQQLAIAGC